MAEKKPSLQNEWSKLSLAELEENLSRIEKLLSKSSIHKQLPDGGVRVLLKRDSLKKEIQFRSEMSQIEGQIGQLTLKNSKSHVAKICSIEKPPKQRFVLNHESKNSSHTQSHAVMINLSSSLELQKAQGDKEKDQRNLKLLKQYVSPLEEENSQEDDSDSSDSSLTHDSSDTDSETTGARETKEVKSEPS